MKKIILVLTLLVTAATAVSCVASNDAAATDCVRIHIRANSNCELDQSVKLLVRDGVVNYLTPYLAECKSKEDAKRTIGNHLSGIEDVADGILTANGFSYASTASLKREKFPYRQYADYSFPEGVYDALILNLGEGDGDNWWCVCFPPLCFVPDEGDENFKYKSKIVEIIKKARGK